MKKMVMAALFGTALALGAGNAHAGGFLADLARPFVGDELADAADDWHTRAGRPLEGGMQMGNRCQTAYGISHPGPLNPIGAPCYVNGDPGRVVF